MTTTSTISEGVAELLAIADVAKLLGIGKSKAKEMDNAGELPLPALRNEKTIKWSRTELLVWVLCQCPSRVSWQQVREQRIRQFRAGAV